MIDTDESSITLTSGYVSDTHFFGGVLCSTVVVMNKAFIKTHMMMLSRVQNRVKVNPNPESVSVPVRAGHCPFNDARVLV